MKLKCKDISLDPHQQPYMYSMNAVSLYLLEPQPCEYVLGVEAAFLCPLIEAADTNGFIKSEDITVSTLNRRASVQEGQ